MNEHSDLADLPVRVQSGTSQVGTNGLAIASLACAIAGWFVFPFVGQVLGLVFGYSARRQMAESGEGGSAFATAGIVLSWLYFGLLVAMMALITVAVVIGLASASS